MVEDETEGKYGGTKWHLEDKMELEKTRHLLFITFSRSWFFKILISASLSMICLFMIFCNNEIRNSFHFGQKQFFKFYFLNDCRGHILNNWRDSILNNCRDHGPIVIIDNLPHIPSSIDSNSATVAPNPWFF